MGAGSNIIVIGYRHDRSEAQSDLDLFDLAVEYRPGRKGRSPICSSEVDDLSIPCGIVLELAFEEPGHQRYFGSVVGNEIEGLSGLVSVAVKGHCGGEVPHGSFTGIEQTDSLTRRLHARPPVARANCRYKIG